MNNKTTRSEPRVLRLCTRALFCVQKWGSASPQPQSFIGVMGLGAFSLAHISLELFATCVCRSQGSWQHLTHSKSIDKALRERGKKIRKQHRCFLFQKLFCHQLSPELNMTSQVEK